MRRRDFIAVAAGMAALPMVGFAQAREQHRIGYLSPGSTSTLPVALQAFRDQLRELGYREGENLIIEYRWAKQRDDQLAPLVRELIDASVEVIVIEGHTPAIKAAKETTRTIPIVMAVSGDPVGTGLVASLAHPGGNVTGMTILTPELAAKRLEVLKEALPNLARLAVLWNAANPVKVLDWQHTEAAARALGIELQSLAVTRAADFDSVFATESGDRADALIVFGDGLINANRARILDFAGRMRLLGMYPYKEFVVEGGVMSYAPSFADLFRRAAVYVDKLLNGARPADLPVQQPIKFEFVINLKTAKALGLDVPRTLLARADEVIE